MIKNSVSTLHIQFLSEALFNCTLTLDSNNTLLTFTKCHITSEFWLIFRYSARTRTLVVGSWLWLDDCIIRHVMSFLSFTATLSVISKRNLYILFRLLFYTDVYIPEHEKYVGTATCTYAYIRWAYAQYATKIVVLNLSFICYESLK